jgi:hypoxanthine phosphoribosyltransferase
MTSVNQDLCLYTYGQILDAIHKISRQINIKTQSKDVVFCPVMSGSLVFAGHLLPLLNHQHLSVNYLHYSRYKDDQGSDVGEWKYLPKREELVNRHIILIDDILDKGNTLQECIKILKKLGAKTILSCVLFYKPNTKSLINADIKGLELPNEYVYGFGLDKSGLQRNELNLYVKNT